MYDTSAELSIDALTQADNIVEIYHGHICRSRQKYHQKGEDDWVIAEVNAPECGTEAERQVGDTDVCEKLDILA
jgi:formylmethanofuran:tetrahydromethanopterin formyltransferase